MSKFKSPWNEDPDEDEELLDDGDDFDDDGYLDFDDEDDDFGCFPVNDMD